MRTSVLARRGAPPVLEFGEEVLDLVTLLAEPFVVGVWNFPVSARRDARLDALCLQGSPGMTCCHNPLSAIRVSAAGNTFSTRRAPLWSFIWPSLSSMIIGRPWFIANDVQSDFGSPDTPQRASNLSYFARHQTNRPGKGSPKLQRATAQTVLEYEPSCRAATMPKVPTLSRLMNLPSMTSEAWRRIDSDYGEIRNL